MFYSYTIELHFPALLLVLFWMLLLNESYIRTYIIQIFIFITNPYCDTLHITLIAQVPPTLLEMPINETHHHLSEQS